MWCRDAEPWLYRLDDHYVWQSPYRFARDYAFQDRFGQTWLVLTSDGCITVLRGYAWDGCSPKWCFLDVLFGTPDGVVSKITKRPKTYYASLIHDALCQFQPAGLPLTRAEADHCFLLLLRRDGFAPRGLYYAAVYLFGRLTQPLTRRLRDTQEGRCVDCTPP